MIKNHSWNLTPSEAIALQKKLREEVDISPLKKSIKTIAGADVSLNRFGKIAYACVVVLSYPELKVLEIGNAQMEVALPYIPGLLSFREIPVLLKAYESLKIKPDLVVVDGQGIAHPRRLGIAAHFGMVTGIPTIGCAKSILYGVPRATLAEEKGSIEFLYDKQNKEEKIGALVRSKNKTKPLVVSPGYKVSIQQAIDITLVCIKLHRLPEPTRFAHMYGNEYRVESREQIQKLFTKPN